MSVIHQMISCFIQSDYITVSSSSITEPVIDDTTLGSTSVSITVKNISGTLLPAPTIFIDNAFFTATNNFPGNLAIDGTYTVTVTFAPLIIGTSTGTMLIRARGKDSQVSLSGFSSKALVIVPEIASTSKNVSLLLRNDGTDLATNSTYVDDGSLVLPVTPHGNVYQGNFSPVTSASSWTNSNGWSSRFNGITPNDYIWTDNVAGGTFSVNPFTIECFALFDNNTVGEQPLLTNAGSQDNMGWAIYIDQNNKLTAKFSVNNTAWDYVITSTYTPPVGAWVHIAVSRSTTSLRLYANGVLLKTQVLPANTTFVNGVPTGGSFQIGRSPFMSSGAKSFQGYISNVRINIANAYYTAATFALPAVPLATNANCTIAICAYPRLRDYAVPLRVMNQSGSVEVRPVGPSITPTIPYSQINAAGSAYFDGNGSALSVPYNVGVNSILALAFAFEVWIYPTAAKDNNFIFGDADGNEENGSFGLSLNAANQVVFTYYTSATTTATITSTASVQLNAWNHICFNKVASSVNIYFAINGYIEFITTPTAIVLRVGTAGYIGSNSAKLNNNKQFIGYITNIRFRKSIISYSGVNGAAYTVPTTPLLIASGTNLLMNFNNAQLLDYTGRNNFNLNGLAKLSTSNFKYGKSSLNLSNGGYLNATNNAETQLGGGDFTFESWIYKTSFDTVLPTILFGQYKSISECCVVQLSTSGTLELNNNGVLFGANTSVVPLNAWVHISVTRAGNVVSLFINGSVVSSLNLDSIAPIYFGTKTATYTYIGGKEDNDVFNGYIDNVCLLKGLDKYLPNFIPPGDLIYLQNKITPSVNNLTFADVTSLDAPTKTVYFSIVNTGSTILPLAPTFSSTNALFTVTSLWTQTLAIGDSFVVVVTFKPVAVGTFTSNIVINVNEASTSVNVTATSTIVVASQYVTFQYNTANVIAVDLGAVAAGGATQKTITVTNNSGIDLLTPVLSTTGTGMSVVSHTCPATFLAGTTFTVIVKSITAAGINTGKLAVNFAGYTGDTINLYSQGNALTKTFAYTGTIDSTWTVPVTGTYIIETFGASSNGNQAYNNAIAYGAYVKSAVKLTAGTVLKVMVGQQAFAQWEHSRGGGGTFVADTNNNPIAVSGGAGGSWTWDYTVPGLARNNGTPLGGQGPSGGGGGFLTDGVGAPGSAFINGGGTVDPTYGGWGGGFYGYGGGGYNGGVSFQGNARAGGGSFSSGVVIEATDGGATPNLNGKVIIRY